MVRHSGGESKPTENATWHVKCEERERDANQ